MVLVVLTISMSMFTSVLASTARESKLKSETAFASDALRATVESMRAENFEEIYARYNSNPADDPSGPGTAPGSNFAVEGLTAAPSDVDGFVGEVDFPEREGKLREDVNDATLAMPRDLNGDGVIDSLDHHADYRILPVHLRVTWLSEGHVHHLDVYTNFVKL